MEGFDQSSLPKLMGLNDIKSPTFTYDLQYLQELERNITIKPLHFTHIIAVINARFYWRDLYHNTTIGMIVSASNQVTNFHVDRNQVARKANMNVVTIIPRVINSPFISIHIM
tara:strand:+ start:196 stop:534 length:339 start_codon:yes stop_codon:yes gene_type:complete